MLKYELIMLAILLLSEVSTTMLRNFANNSQNNYIFDMIN